MKSFILEHDDQSVRVQGDMIDQNNQQSFELHYCDEDGEAVTTWITKDKEGYLIRETSAMRQLYLSLSYEEEEGYMKTPYGMLIFKTQLIADQWEEEGLQLSYHLDDGQGKMIRDFKLFLDNQNNGDEK